MKQQIIDIFPPEFYKNTAYWRGFVLALVYLAIAVAQLFTYDDFADVVTEYGLIPIARIDRPMRVLSWNEKTCRFQLSWCGGGFPKGTDYLYRVTTPQGEFSANEHHLVYDGHRAYRHVKSLALGQSVSQYSGSQPLTALVRDLLLSQTDDMRSRQTAEDSLASYAASARRYGQQLRRYVARTSCDAYKDS